jgi:AmiR/NasT family two-component response regulator
VGLARGVDPVLAKTRRTVEQLQAAVSVRATIDQAIGILISRSGGTAQEAIATLRTISGSTNTKLASVARHVVQETARRVRTGQSKP